MDASVSVRDVPPVTHGPSAGRNTLPALYLSEDHGGKRPFPDSKGHTAYTILGNTLPNPLSIISNIIITIVTRDVLRSQNE